MMRMGQLVMAAMLAGCAFELAGCAFELADVVVPAGAGGAGAGDAGAGAAGVGAAGAAGAGAAGAGANGSGGAAVGYEITLTVGPTGGVNESLVDFPVLVKLDPTRIDYRLTATDGADLRFVDADGSSPLAHEIEHWDPSGTSMVWVELASLVEGGQFYLRFGDPAASGLLDVSDVWSSYIGVYHFADVSDAADAVSDSSGHGHHGTAINVAADASGPFGENAGQAAAFDGSSSRIDLGNVPDFDVPAGGQRSFALWIRRNTTDEVSMTPFRVRSSCCVGYTFRLLPDLYSNLRHDVTGLVDANAGCCNGTDAALGMPHGWPGGASGTAWHAVAVVMDQSGGWSAVYVDGVQLEKNGSDTVPMPTGTVSGSETAIGVNEYDAAFMLGSLDELRVADRAFSDGWVAVQYLSQTDALLEYGVAVQR